MHVRDIVSLFFIDMCPMFQGAHDTGFTVVALVQCFVHVYNYTNLSVTLSFDQLGEESILYMNRFKK